ncbi:unnamed protein product [Cuscuta epithymum]|uniref:RING-type E3 ubiquitin transferase n=1 Tax=Cuscuta epithymum TaxID=186058 RepID=A0AAV0G917_9ASTE|nr:unnamed protein product [Cuscuta epithymum]
MADVSISLLQLLNDENDDFRQNDDIDSLPYWCHDFDDTFDAFSSTDLSNFHSSDLPQISTSVRRRQTGQSLDGDAFEGECIDFFDRDNQVNFVMDLFHQRVEQSQSPLQVIMDPHLINADPAGFGVIYEDEVGTGSAQLEVDRGRGLGLQSGDLTTRNCENSTLDLDNCDDELHFISGLRVIDLGSDSESDGNPISGLNFNPEDVGDGIDGPVMYESESDDPSLRLCWESFQLEDRREVNRDYEWEEVDGRVDEREILSMFLDEDGISVPDQEEREVMGNLEWEVLLNDHDLDPNPESRIEGFDLGELDQDQDEYNYTTEYEMMFAQFADVENVSISKPPASKSVVKNLPEVILSKEDDPDKNDATICAVCKDEMSIGEMVRVMPCAHKYHQNCIFPWLGLRNTCPVCRYELPTDDPEYERRRRRTQS